ncbi:MAG: DNA polymerase III subunit gamma/tau [Candidatus Nomurabacteria bacterium]|jgi:DNA polymerase-3 subunit gamma/tau|nr:DNA polymerase III subunit gamma/tau [Candidatus Nomurabacteria bacterium]
MKKALYRKYRSTKLSEIVGQEHIVEILQNALKSKKINHAYLFTGPRGVGKTSIARILAHEINNFPYEIEDQYTDIIEIDAASNTGVDNIRNLIDNAPIAPTRGEYKIYIIDEVHMLSKSAFNALLKTLEEPPAHVVFIMATTEFHKIPATILSRSQRFNFRPAAKSTVVQHLQKIASKENINISPAALEIIAEAGGGSFRDSIGILDQVATVKSGDQLIDRADLEQLLGIAQSELIGNLVEDYERKDFKVLDTLRTAFIDCHDPKLLAERLLEYLIENPNRVRLDLAEKLISVLDSPSAKVKLMTVLSDFGDNFDATPAPKTIAQPPATTDTPPRQTKKPPTPVSSTTAEAAPTAKPPTPTRKVHKDTILSFVRQKSIPLYALLEKLEFDISGSSIRIFAPTAFAKKKIDKLGYKSLIAEAANGDYTIVVEAGRVPSKSQAMSKIVNIMGGGEEVEINEQ